MPMTKEQILAEAMALDPREREALADELLLSLTDGDHAAIDAAWLAEVRRREEAFVRGETSTSPLDAVMARLQARAKQP